eukprot:PRCOL_00005876-RA
MRAACAAGAPRRPPAARSGALRACRRARQRAADGGGEAGERFAFEGVARAYGAEGAAALRRARVAVVGVGGVGSWAAEALARTGVGSITLVDLDEVCVSNVNRQAYALTSTVGRPKVDVAAQRIADINAECDVRCVHDFVSVENVSELLAPPLDCVVDCVDDFRVKAAIVAHCRRVGVRVVTTGGAAGADNAAAVRTDDLARAQQNPLLAKTRKELRARYRFPAARGGGKTPKKWGVPAVYPPQDANSVATAHKGGRAGGGRMSCDALGGSLCFVTGAQGFVAAGEAVNAIVSGAAQARGVERGSEAAPAAAGEASARREAAPGAQPATEELRLARQGQQGAGGMDPSGTAQGARVQAEAEVSDLRADPALVAASYDAHCHAHLDDTHEGVAAMESLFERVSGVALMSTGEGDWDRIQAAAAKARAGGSAGSVRCLLGVHPWFAHRYAGEGDGWLEDLRARLVGTPGACIGEIGLDKQWVTPDTGRVEYDAQLEVFKAQLELAAELRLPVSVHCVRAQGDLQAILSAAKALPPTIYLHAFGGAVGTVQQLCKSKKFGDRLYFGFAHCVNMRSKKTPAVIAAVPPDRLLLESDRGSAAEKTACGDAEVDAELDAMLRVYAEATGTQPEEVARRTAANAVSMYAPADEADATLGRAHAAA